MKKIILSILLLSVPTFAQTISYSENSSLRLGAGVDMDHPDKARANCVKSTDREWLDGNTPVSTSFDLSMIETSNELERKMNFDIQLNAAGTIKAVNIDSQNSYRVIHKFLENKNSLNFALTAEFSYGRKGLTEESLKPEYQTLLNDGKWQEVLRRCGTHFVSEEIHRSKVIVLIHVKNSRTEDIKEKILDLKNKLKVPKLNFGADLNVQYKEFIRKLDKIGSVEVKVVSVGGQGADALGVFANEIAVDDLQSIKNAAERYFSSFTIENSPVFAYVVKPLDIFEGAENIHPKQKKWQQLKILADWLFEHEELLTEIKSMQARASRALYVGYFEPKLAALEAKINEVRFRAEECLERYNCDNLPAVAPFSVQVPSRAVGAVALNTQCGYLPVRNSRMQILSDVRVGLDVDLMYSKDIENIEMFRLDQNGEFQNANYGQNEEMVLANNILESEVGRVRRYQSVNEFSANHVLSDRAILSAQDSVGKAQEIFNAAFNSVYILKIRFKQGQDLTQILGAPPMKDCSVSK
ncbi:hypothetical protein EZJ49_12920 [Bdellovibrio bacteriovorus]|uniref:hypothetical protein n=1 Tax=Bdellovibrio bacteriovorus TaxID=959 RepID=UPI0021D1D5D4|nr:hypothetical protein [Bdellovibrio bacteriovorus]UXR63968.1 hypothetical protein EZJ49_12920 [Bdellovibrio bacteriovorus]